MTALSSLGDGESRGGVNQTWDTDAPPVMGEGVGAEETGGIEGRGYRAAPEPDLPGSVPHRYL